MEVSFENLSGKGHLQISGLHVNIKLKWISQKLGVTVWMDSCGSG